LPLPLTFSVAELLSVPFFKDAVAVRSISPPALLSTVPPLMLPPLTTSTVPLSILISPSLTIATESLSVRP